MLDEKLAEAWIESGTVELAEPEAVLHRPALIP